jgi:hypothetical protein
MTGRQRIRDYHNPQLIGGRKSNGRTRAEKESATMAEDRFLFAGEVHIPAQPVVGVPAVAAIRPSHNLRSVRLRSASGSTICSPFHIPCANCRRSHCAKSFVVDEAFPAGASASGSRW